MMNATESQAEKAIATLKRAINAAENSNQAGENAVVIAAAALSLLDEDTLTDIITDTLDMDWHPRWAAKAIMAEIGLSS